MWQDIESVLHPPASSSTASSNNELVSDRALVHGLVQHSENGGHLSTASPDFTSDFSNRALIVGDPPNAYYSNHYDLGHTSTGKGIRISRNLDDINILENMVLISELQ